MKNFSNQLIVFAGMSSVVQETAYKCLLMYFSGAKLNRDDIYLTQMVLMFQRKLHFVV